MQSTLNVEQSYASYTCREHDKKDGRKEGREGRYICEVIDVLIHVSDHQVVQLKYLTILSVNYISIKLVVF